MFEKKRPFVCLVSHNINQRVFPLQAGVGAPFVSYHYKIKGTLESHLFNKTGIPITMSSVRQRMKQLWAEVDGQEQRDQPHKLQLSFFVQDGSTQCIAKQLNTLRMQVQLWASHESPLLSIFLSTFIAILVAKHEQPGDESSPESAAANASVCPFSREASEVLAPRAFPWDYSLHRMPAGAKRWLIAKTADVKAFGKILGFACWHERCFASNQVIHMLMSHRLIHHQYSTNMKDQQVPGASRIHACAEGVMLPQIVHVRFHATSSEQMRASLFMAVNGEVMNYHDIHALPHHLQTLVFVQSASKKPKSNILLVYKWLIWQCMANAVQLLETPGLSCLNITGRQWVQAACVATRASRYVRLGCVRPWQWRFSFAQCTAHSCLRESGSCATIREVDLQDHTLVSLMPPSCVLDTQGTPAHPMSLRLHCMSDLYWLESDALQHVHSPSTHIAIRSKRLEHEPLLVRGVLDDILHTGLRHATDTLCHEFDDIKNMLSEWTSDVLMVLEEAMQDLDKKSQTNACAGEYMLCKCVRQRQFPFITMQRVQSE